ncbi:methylenetetrahydrofolate--tRNA-(uracil(54)-C(5))-methyltransferase (FADH(2)-oxidizing) TrmFO [Dethiobacter alkaliphilus]|uniref:methylenetetrahydrofolate--tRNA-(uracil(54)- C(5))-methyltransferase (FADH(2)-oxidizing) TrmFO n=1 Tax=Dethiobacter alkaliphilus TaxID=427926 RepID=UPI0022274989|nr:methylenetetrahydrofolate--tRNA-(uracil(54)-C(5))-methyltransferase (FADH(2)-oxidizing) TrmFO [Dethiobacter alkaliphilus]MCW3490865.1 methylenetetrahydrofolate--tRNA-(uracil(54)-C(5))-methyltransferase (FADH(2)-oxidizing) TrmFO [Dethiobacter alkaliphilus]
MAEITIVGGGLAGAEAAWQVAKTGLSVRLYEMRPHKMTPAHHGPHLAELVCSNSLRAASLENAVGLLKEEMRKFDSLIIAQADKHAVPAGGALAVDREGFARGVTEAIDNLPNVVRVDEEVREIPATTAGPVILATGPLTAEDLADEIGRLTGEDSLYFYDAAAPIVTAESIDMKKVFRASRYGKGTADYLNCPMDEEEYQQFYTALTTADVYEGHCDTDEKKYFEGCMPVEVMASRGYETLKFGPLKPVGLTDPNTGQQAFAVVQLRQDNAAATLYNMVGFQTRLRWPEQKRVFRMIPGLENAEFARYGVMHRNTYINSPKTLQPTLQFKENDKLFFAGQVTGVEGYVESAAMGLVAGINAARVANGQDPLVWPNETAHGSLTRYITTADPDNFQPMNVNFGIFPPLATRVPKKERKKAMAERALAKVEQWRLNWQN